MLERPHLRTRNPIPYHVPSVPVCTLTHCLAGRTMLEQINGSSAIALGSSKGTSVPALGKQFRGMPVWC